MRVCSWGLGFKVSGGKRLFESFQKESIFVVTDGDRGALVEGHPVAGWGMVAHKSAVAQP